MCVTVCVKEGDGLSFKAEIPALTIVTVRNKTQSFSALTAFCVNKFTYSATDI